LQRSRRLTEDDIGEGLAQIERNMAALQRRVRRGEILHPTDRYWERSSLKQMLGVVDLRGRSPQESLQIQFDLIRYLETLRTQVELRRNRPSRR
jgi:hypothetical protein